MKISSNSVNPISARLCLETRYITRITYIGMGVNIGLAALKLFFGYFAGSFGLIADGFHSFSDLGSDIVILLGAWFAGRPPDMNHPFGHGKFETISAWLIALILIIVGGWVTWESFSAFGREATLVKSWWVILIAVISLSAKEYLYQATVKVAKLCRSNALKANAWHHRTDAFSSAMVLFGGIGGLIGWHRGDSLAGMIVGVMVLVVGFKLFFESAMELSEASAGLDTEESINEIISSFDEVRGWHKLRIRRIGRQLEMDVHIIIDAEMSVQDGHRVVKRIEHALEEGLEWPINPVIHLDPDSKEIKEPRRS